MVFYQIRSLKIDMKYHKDVKMLDPKCIIDRLC